MTSVTGLAGLTSSVAWRIFMKDPEKQLDKFEKNKDIQKELTYFKDKLSKVKSVDELLKDPRATKVLLSAYDLQDEAVQGLGRIRKVLTEDPTATGALSSKLADSRFAAIAKDLRLDQGLTTLKSSTKLAAITDKYVQSEFEQALGAQDPALREAAYFARNIGSKTGSVYNILGDKIVRDVVQNTLNIPAQLAIQPVETQARVITSRLDITKFAQDLKASGGLSASQVTTAKQDTTTLDGYLKISDAAIKQIKSLQATIGTTLGNYDALLRKTQNSGETTTQQHAIPELIRDDQLLGDGKTVIDSVVTKLTELKNIVVNDGDPRADVTFNRGRFYDQQQTFRVIKSEIDGLLKFDAAATPSVDSDEPNTESLFHDTGADDTLSTDLNAAGSIKAAVTTYSLASFNSDFTAAYSAFRTAANHNDTAKIAAATAKLNAVIDRAKTIQTTIASDTTKLNTVYDDVSYGAVVNSTSLASGKSALGDAVTRSDTISSLLTQIGQLATTSAGRALTADRSDLSAQFATLRTQLNNTIGTPNASGTDNLLTADSAKKYNLLDRSDGQGGTEHVDLYAYAAAPDLGYVVDTLNASDIGDANGAQDLAAQLGDLRTTVTSVTKNLQSDLSAFTKAIDRYDPKAKLDATIVGLTGKLNTAIAGAASGKANLLSSAQSDISFTLGSNNETVKLHPAKTFSSDFLSQLQHVTAQFGNGLAATRQALSGLEDVVDRTARYLQSDNRELTFEQGRVGAVLDAADPATAADGTSRYKVNSFTEKFLTRYLILNGSDGNTFSSAQASTLNLFSGTASASSILSLSLSV